MFIPLTEQERQTFMSQTTGSLIPGSGGQNSYLHYMCVAALEELYTSDNLHYVRKLLRMMKKVEINRQQISELYAMRYTGHCPTLKFRFGRCYGANTKDIMQELREKGILKSIRREQYRADDPGKVVLTPIKYSRDQNRNPADDIKCKSAKYILGYTGYIPGLNFRYGKSYSRSADDSMYEFGERQSESKRKWESDRMQRANSAPKMIALHSKDKVAKSLKEYELKNKFTERTLSPEFPPIAGYTGHIPRIKGNEVSLSRRYYCVAKHGLSLLQQDRNRRNQLTDVENKIDTILNEAENTY